MPEKTEHERAEAIEIRNSATPKNALQSRNNLKLLAFFLETRDYFALVSNTFLQNFKILISLAATSSLKPKPSILID